LGPAGGTTIPSARPAPKAVAAAGRARVDGWPNAEKPAAVVEFSRRLHELVEPFLPRAAGALKSPELAQLLAAKAVVTATSCVARAHLPGAVNIPIEQIESRLAELHALRGQPVLHCRSGNKGRR
jgi:hypothetical protein